LYETGQSTSHDLWMKLNGGHHLMYLCWSLNISSELRRFVVC